MPGAESLKQTANYFNSPYKTMFYLHIRLKVRENLSDGGKEGENFSRD
jgi:hypothetical protein